MALSEINGEAIAGLSAINGIAAFDEILGISTIVGATIGPIDVAANGDDGQIKSSPEEFHDDGENDDGVGWFGDVGSTRQFVFLRFVLPSGIPSGATISSATLEAYGRDQFNWDNGVDDIDIFATDSANASAPTTAGQRPNDGSGGSTAVTTAVASWDNVTWNTAGYNTSSSIASVIQELVDDNAGLASGAGIVLWLRIDQSNPGSHYAALELLEHAGINPSRLTITWTL